MNVTPPVEIAAWLACLTFCVMLFNHLSKAWFTLRGKPTPIEQQQATSGIAERVSRIEVCVVDQSRRLVSLETDGTRTREHIAAEIDKVFRRINAVADMTSANNGQLSGIHSQLVQLLGRSGH